VMDAYLLEGPAAANTANSTSPAGSTAPTAGHTP